MTELTLPQLFAASGTLVLASLLSLVSALGVHRSLVVAAVRTVAQLLLVGAVLRWVFVQNTAWVSALIFVVMLGAATLEVGARQERRLVGAWHALAGGVPVAAVTTAVVLLALITVVRPEPLTSPRVAIPLAGIVLGTAMSSASIALNHLFGSVANERAALEAQLCLGASASRAAHGLLVRSLRAGMIPAINQMAAAGIVSLPGIMTGQLLAGADPTSAAKYQIALLLLLAGASFFATYGALRLALHRLFDDRDRLRLDRLAPRAAAPALRTFR